MSHDPIEDSDHVIDLISNHVENVTDQESSLLFKFEGIIFGFLLFFEKNFVYFFCSNLYDFFYENNLIFLANYVFWALKFSKKMCKKNFRVYNSFLCNFSSTRKTTFRYFSNFWISKFWNFDWRKWEIYGSSSRM